MILFWQILIVISVGIFCKARKHKCEEYDDQSVEEIFRSYSAREERNWHKLNEKFEKKHGRQKFVDHASELAYRKNLLKKTAKKLNKINKELGGTACVGLNEMAALDDEEFSAGYLGLAPVDAQLKIKYNGKRMGHDRYRDTVLRKTSNNQKVTLVLGIKESKGKRSIYDAIAPKIFWHTGPVTGQGGCRSCVFFASVGFSALHSYNNSHGGVASACEQQVIDCASSSVCDCSYGCHTWTLMDYFLENGLTTDASYMRYNASVGTCMKDVPGGILESHRTDWDLTDAEIVMHLQNGPVVSVVCIDDEFRFYRGGILGEINRPYCQTPNHAIAIVGYGTDEYGVDYWIGKNSHWTTWGEGGYFRVKKVGGRNTKRDHVFGAYVTIPELAAYPTVENVNRYDYTLGSHDCTDYATWCWVLPCAPECGVITAPTGDNVNCTEKEGALNWCQKTCQNVWPNGNGICPLQYPPKYVKDMMK